MKFQFPSIRQDYPEVGIDSSLILVENVKCVKIQRKYDFMVKGLCECQTQVPIMNGCGSTSLFQNANDSFPHTWYNIIRGEIYWEEITISLLVCV